MELKYDAILKTLHINYETLKQLLTEPLFNDRLQPLSNSLELEKLNLLIAGEFSWGMCTSINAILRRPYLPANVNPTITTTNLIQYSEIANTIIR